ncbi:sarcoplasmic calcium-binding protein [Chrysoperla carnea]|uniref:sarcoplasmic calcium-binding protein n=1 Tax=Chrysoperla carnea TaxID=189513 RepID=UPI001D08B962|nr:sarcoplasmic calcium-binding protein [Chrysoperla carnea]
MAFSLLRRFSCRLYSASEFNLNHIRNKQTWNFNLKCEGKYCKIEWYNQRSKIPVKFEQKPLAIMYVNMLSLREYGTKRDRPEKKIDYNSDSDSDDESHHHHHKRHHHHHHKRGESSFWRRKMRTIHRILDVNKDGVISYDDFKLMADRFVELGHLSPECEVEFYKTIQALWEEQWGEINPYNLVTVEQYLEDMYHVVNDEDRRNRVHLFLPYLFKAVDKDQSGKISVEEFKLFFQCLGLSPESAVATFSIIDKNTDGFLSLDEFVLLGREFLISEDETKVSQMFWGPLIEK